MTMLEGEHYEVDISYWYAEKWYFDRSKHAGYWFGNFTGQ